MFQTIGILSWLALVFLTLAGFSAGAVLGSRLRPGGRGVTPSPTLLDTATVLTLWVVGAAWRLAGTNEWIAAGVWLLVALITALVLTLLQQPAEGEQLLH